VGFDVPDQLLITSFIVVKYWRKKWEYNETVPQLFIDLKKTYDSTRREVLYNIIIEFGMPMKLFGLIKICLIETWSKVHIGNQLSDNVPMQNGLKQGDALAPLLFNFALEFTIRKVQETKVGLKYMGHISCWSMLMI
jgi:hypothetical protein